MKQRRVDEQRIDVATVAITLLDVLWPQMALASSILVLFVLFTQVSMFGRATFCVGIFNSLFINLL